MDLSVDAGIRAVPLQGARELDQAIGAAYAAALRLFGQSIYPLHLTPCVAAGIFVVRGFPRSELMGAQKKRALRVNGRSCDLGDTSRAGSPLEIHQS